MMNPNAKILVVDDVAENRDLLLRRLTRLGFQSTSIKPRTGSRRWRRSGPRPTTSCLLDIMMPELDGFGVLEKLARRRPHQRSAGDRHLGAERNRAGGALHRAWRRRFHVKPFNPTLLRARVLTTLEKKALTDLTRDELRRKQYELNEARTLQLALAPPPFAGQVSGRTLSIDVLLEPAKEVGGDLVDHFRIGEDMVVLALGDVSDKGAGAALMMARTHAMFRALTTRPDAADLFREPAARGWHRQCGARRRATTAACSLRSCWRRSTWRPGGWLMCAPAISRRSTATAPARSPAWAAWAVRRWALSKPRSIRADEITLAPGDRLLMVTDGFTEAHDPAARFMARPGSRNS